MAVMRQHQNPTAESRWVWSVGKIAGIPTGVHASFVLLLGWIAYRAVSSGGSLWVVVASLAFTLAVFASVLMHEFGHALVARHFGIATDSIMLYPLGGVARLLGTPSTSRAELWIAVAGPAVNVLLAGVSFGFYWAWIGAAGIPWLSNFAGAFIYANIALAVFNMLPAFPMDGGRVLRAVLRRRRGLLPATEIAVVVGKAFAVFFALIGLFSNPMLVFIAPFVWIAGNRELTQVRWHYAQATGRRKDVSRMPRPDSRSGPQLRRP